MVYGKFQKQIGQNFNLIRRIVPKFVEEFL